MPVEQQELRERGSGSSGEDTGGEEGSLKPVPSLGPDSVGTLGGHDWRARWQVSAFPLAPLVWWGQRLPVSLSPVLCSTTIPTWVCFHISLVLAPGINATWK